MKYDTPFAARFKAIREEKMGISQENMATKLGISQQSVSFYEKGDRLPDYYVIKRICDETGCSLKYLFGYQESMCDYNEEWRKDLGLSDQSLYCIRHLTDEMREVLNRLLESTSFEALLNIMNYTFSTSEKCTSPIEKGFQWDHGAYMCSRVFDDVMDEQFDKMLSKLSNAERAKYDSAITKEHRERQNTGFRKKTRLPLVQYEKGPEDYLSKFKLFRAMMQETIKNSSEE